MIRAPLYSVSVNGDCERHGAGGAAARARRAVAEAVAAGRGVVVEVAPASGPSAREVREVAHDATAPDVDLAVMRAVREALALRPRRPLRVTVA